MIMIMKTCLCDKEDKNILLEFLTIVRKIEFKETPDYKALVLLLKSKL
jgi:hypothetical protein